MKTGGAQRTCPLNAQEITSLDSKLRGNPRSRFPSRGRRFVIRDAGGSLSEHGRRGHRKDREDKGDLMRRRAKSTAAQVRITRAYRWSSRADEREQAQRSPRRGPTCRRGPFPFARVPVHSDAPGNRP